MHAGDPWSKGTRIRVAGAVVFGVGALLFVSEPNPFGASRFTTREAAGALIGTVGAIIGGR
ncbi:MAG: hypothetical protein H0T46_14405 [Deltaproteobacteria bacterium]|nr:hypothetical protein [Deltaproteobacteria bacterium]